MSKQKKNTNKPKKQSPLALQNYKQMMAQISIGFADKHLTRLRFKTFETITSAGAAHFGLPFVTNGVYDVDLRFGSTTMAYAAELFAIWQYARVLVVDCVVQVTNNETFAVKIVTVHENTNPGTSGASVRGYSERPLAQTRVLGNYSGQNRGRLHSRHSICEIVGTKAPLYEDNFRGTTSSNPVDLTYFGVYFDSGSNTFSAAGVTLDIELTFLVSFYDRITVVS